MVAVLSIVDASGQPLTSGSLHNIFGPGVAGGATDYAVVQARNGHASAAVTGVSAWLAVDAGGAAIAIAALTPDSAGRVNAPGGSYSTPTSRASGLALSDIPAGGTVYLGIRRVLAGASPAYPESNRLYVAGTTPA